MDHPPGAESIRSVAGSYLHTRVVPPQALNIKNHVEQVGKPSISIHMDNLYAVIPVIFIKSQGINLTEMMMFYL